VDELTQGAYNAMAAELNAEIVMEQQKELRRLGRIERAAMRVAIARESNGCVTRQSVLDALVRALSAMPEADSHD
jgi:hypothetical protein